MRTKEQIEKEIKILKDRIDKGIAPDAFREQIRALLWVLGEK